jgi:ankyrin repeat protein
MIAAEKGNEQFVRMLVENGADVNAKSKNDTTPLISAAVRGRVEVIRLLAKKGRMLTMY